MSNDEIINVRYMVDDVEESIAFYTELLGFEVLTNARAGVRRCEAGQPPSVALRAQELGGPSDAGRRDARCREVGTESTSSSTTSTPRSDGSATPARRSATTSWKDPAASRSCSKTRPATSSSCSSRPPLIAPTTATTAATHSGLARRGDGRRRFDDRRRRVQRWGPAADAAGTGLLDRSRRRRGRRVLQRHLLGPAGRRAPRVGWDLRVRPPPARAVLGAPRRVGVRRRQDRLVRRARAHRRRVPVARTRPPRRCRSGRRPWPSSTSAG